MHLPLWNTVGKHVQFATSRCVLLSTTRSVINQRAYRKLTQILYTAYKVPVNAHSSSQC
jgi:hypothetical protein